MATTRRVTNQSDRAVEPCPVSPTSRIKFPPWLRTSSRCLQSPETRTAEAGIPIKRGADRLRDPPLFVIQGIG